MSIQIPALARQWLSGDLEPAAYAVAYFLHWQIARHGVGFASRTRKSDPRADSDTWLALLDSRAPAWRECLADRIERYQFTGVSTHATSALARWLHGDWPLQLRDSVPEPLEVLRLQARGERAVTALSTWPRMSQPVLNKTDGFAFFLHDLEHAYKFYHCPRLHADQRALFSALVAVHASGAFAACLEDEEFPAKFHYLVSDMNTHPEHARKYLRAILIDCGLRREGKTGDQALSVPAEKEIDAIMRSLSRSD